MELELVQLDVAEGVNLVLGQSHFIKTVEDVYEAVVNTVPGAKFGVAFNEASGPCLTRFDGTDEELVALAVANLGRIGAGHVFLVLLRNVFPINVLGRLKEVPEVVRLYCATANPVQVVVAVSEQGRGVMGVIDGSSPKGVEGEEEKEARRAFLRKIGYKR